MDRQPVLIVDDDPIIRETLMEALGSGGYLVQSADTAEEALRKMGETRFAVVLTDMHMPGGASGLQLLSEIRRIDPRLTTFLARRRGFLVSRA